MFKKKIVNCFRLTMFGSGCSEKGKCNIRDIACWLHPNVYLNTLPSCSPAVAPRDGQAYLVEEVNWCSVLMQ